MPIQRLSITTVVPSRRDPYKYISLTFEVEAEDFDDVFEQLAEDGCIRGYRIETKTLPDSTRVATERVPHIVGLQGIAILCPVHFDYVYSQEIAVDE
ncbi:hypothetical protein [Brucella pseudogrignonensis]|uniref:Uncharacterized protein n=1 Tax=Brucella pseudogrignonensis TaxID=419475 RepID=A0ABU1M604_9HYPH|nr:hypothetical protein [Brucella pseudogrignonensis]MDR6431262.1 hypothetical protein [Brucella pseudogrignonensis]